MYEYIAGEGGKGERGGEERRGREKSRKNEKDLEKENPSRGGKSCGSEQGGLKRSSLKS